MQFQLINGNVSLLLFKGNNILFLQSLLEDTFTSCQNFIKGEKYLSLSYMIYQRVLLIRRGMICIGEF